MLLKWGQILCRTGGEITSHCLWAVRTLRAARFALGAESYAFGRTLTFEPLPPLNIEVSSLLEWGLEVVDSD
jgi:hypothetical protein